MTAIMLSFSYLPLFWVILMIPAKINIKESSAYQEYKLKC